MLAAPNSATGSALPLRGGRAPMIHEQNRREPECSESDEHCREHGGCCLVFCFTPAFRHAAVCSLQLPYPRYPCGAANGATEDKRAGVEPSRTPIC
jgi:hypothetical protein